MRYCYDHITDIQSSANSDIKIKEKFQIKEITLKDNDELHMCHTEQIYFEP